MGNAIEVLALKRRRINVEQNREFVIKFCEFFLFLPHFCSVTIHCTSMYTYVFIKNFNPNIHMYMYAYHSLLLSMSERYYTGTREFNSALIAEDYGSNEV